jgi:hypothetical protein
MSGYLLSLVQRARGEGAALQPRVRGRFEPGGFEEISTEVAAAAPAAGTAVARDEVTLPSAIGEHQIPAPPLATETNVGRALARPDGLKPVLHDVDGEPPRLIEREERVENVAAAPASSPEVRVEIERAAPQASTPSVPPPQPPLRVQTTRHTTRTIAHQLEHEHDDDPAIHITIGRIDVRAVAPPAPSRPAPTPKRNAPLTLEDYLRRRDGEKR